jgi:hypothetical protein
VAFSVRRLGQDPAAGDQTADVQFPWKRSRLYAARAHIRTRPTAKSRSSRKTLSLRRPCQQAPLS